MIQASTPNKILSNLVALHFGFLYAITALIRNDDHAFIYPTASLWFIVSLFGTFRLHQAFATRKALQVKSKFPAYISYAFALLPVSLAILFALLSLIVN